MKKFVLITVFLQLCLSVLEVSAGGGGASASQNQPQFGDLIEFPQQKIGNKPVYSHYGIYVGGETVKGKDKDQNIFEMTRDPPGCRFSTKQGPFTIRNDYFKDPPQSKAGMIVTIEALMGPDSGRCKEYSLDKENCEMVATFVRYGVAMCIQKGTIMEGAAKLTNPREKKAKMPKAKLS